MARGRTTKAALSPASGSDSSWNDGPRGLTEILSDTSYKSLLDVGGSKDWYSLAATPGRTLIAMDREEQRVTWLYRRAKTERLSILPIVGDVLWPAPGLGPCNEFIAPAMSRLKCDIVVALGLVPHFVFERHMRFDVLLRALGGFANKAIVVDFVSLENPSVRELWSRCSNGYPSGFYDWYNLDAFLESARRQYSTVRTWPSQETSRVLVYCER